MASQCQCSMRPKEHTKESKTYFKSEYAKAIRVDRGKQHQSSAELCLLQFSILYTECSNSRELQRGELGGRCWLPSSVALGIYFYTAINSACNSAHRKIQGQGEKYNQVTGRYCNSSQHAQEDRNYFHYHTNQWDEHQTVMYADLASFFVFVEKKTLLKHFTDNFCIIQLDEQKC